MQTSVVMVEEGISLDKLLTGNATSQNTPTPKVSVKTGSNANTDASNSKSSVTPLSTAKTLESYHTQNMRRIRDERDNIVELKKELHEKKRQFFDIEEQFKNPAALGSQTYIHVLTGRQRLEKEIHDLEERIRNIETGDAETDYFLTK